MAIDRHLTTAISNGNGRIIITVPPRHGKSYLVSQYLPAWYLGLFPENRVILSSYEADFAASWGRRARNVLLEHAGMFGQSAIVAGDSFASSRWDTLAGGGMMTAGVGGAVTGKGGNLVIVDDPVKNYEEAHSEVYREKTWDWFTSTLYTRIEPKGACIVIQTRWHEDDLTGRIIDRLTHEDWRVVNFPAIAESHDVIGRKPGEALWPERFGLDDLNRIRLTLGSYQWSALYQQRPAPDEGIMFQRGWFSIVPDYPREITQVVRAWDKAASVREGDYSAGVLLGKDRVGCYYVLDVVRGQWGSFDRDRIIRQTAELDRVKFGKGLSIWFEQEPGAAGKDSVAFAVRDLAGFNVHAEPSSGSKETRARPFASQVEAGNVKLVRGPWCQAYLDELVVFPHGTHDDQVDASSLAFNKLTLVKRITVGSR